MRRLIERREGRAPVVGEGQDDASPVIFDSGTYEQSLLLKAAQDAAQERGVEAEGGRELAR